MPTSGRLHRFFSGRPHAAESIDAAAFAVPDTMMTKETIRDLIAAKVDCTAIDVRGDDGAHFEATIVAPAFAGKSRVARHQMVYGALGEHMKEAIHALSFRTLTPEESAAEGAPRG